MIDFYASATHYFSHILPIYLALPENLRGTFYVPSRIAVPARARGIPVRQKAVPLKGPPIVVASFGDYRTARNREVIFVEHGAGQTYFHDMKGSPGYAGGKGRERSILFICPSESVAEKNREVYPTIPTAIVGCPRLDAHHLNPRPDLTNPPTVAITFHADYNVTPETTSGYRHFHAAIPLLRAAGYRLLAHAHPRIYSRLIRIYDRYQIPHTPSSETVLKQASVLCVDNSSLGFEAASLGTPLVWLSPPAYRRDVHHGLRFWDALILGEHAERPEEVPDAVARALAPIDPSLYHQRQEFMSSVYQYRDGRAAERAAEAVVAVVGEREQAGV